MIEGNSLEICYDDILRENYSDMWLMYANGATHVEVASMFSMEPWLYASYFYKEKDDLPSDVEAMLIGFKFAMFEFGRSAMMGYIKDRTIKEETVITVEDENGVKTTTTRRTLKVIRGDPTILRMYLKMMNDFVSEKDKYDINKAIAETARLAGEQGEAEPVNVRLVDNEGHSIDLSKYDD